jgi:ABC-type spermidine/putrescine transport system permease subunit I
MGLLPALVASMSDAPLDWAVGAAASIVFVAVIAIPAAALNAREHKRRQAEKATGQP